MRRLPPLNSLRAFEAAARHLSFARAAQELHVTPAAISQQIRSLEEFAGVKLFRRKTRAVVLTDAAQAALPALREGFDRFVEGYAAMRRHEETGTLTVSMPPSFGAKWLIPRLDRFHRLHPDLDMRIDTSERLIDFERDEVDVAIRYGHGSYPGLHSECLLSDSVAPVCSPALIDGDPPLREPADLARHVLLQVRWKMLLRDGDAGTDFVPDWRMWLRAAGLTDIDPDRGPQFSLDSMALQAAIAGQGVALAPSTLTEEDIRAGRLVRPFGAGIGTGPSARPFRYYVVCPEADKDRAKVQAFRSWVLAEAAEAESVAPTG